MKFLLFSDLYCDVVVVERFVECVFIVDLFVGVGDFVVVCKGVEDVLWVFC